MSNKLDELRNSVVPHSDAVDYDEDELEKIYDQRMNHEGFSSADYVVLTGAPDTEQSLERAELAAAYLEGRDEGEIPRVLAPPEQKERLEYFLEEAEFIYDRMEPETSQDEIVEACERISSGGSAVFVTHDYHAPRFENYLNKFSRKDHRDTRDSLPENFKEFMFSQPEGEPEFDYLVLTVENEPDFRAESEAVRSAPQSVKKLLG